jgi:hypothetical protein
MSSPKTAAWHTSRFNPILLNWETVLYTSCEFSINNPGSYSIAIKIFFVSANDASSIKDFLKLCRWIDFLNWGEIPEVIHILGDSRVEANSIACLV